MTADTSPVKSHTRPSNRPTRSMVWWGVAVLLVSVALAVMAASLVGSRRSTSVATDAAQRNKDVADAATNTAEQLCEKLRAKGGVCDPNPSAIPSPVPVPPDGPVALRYGRDGRGVTLRLVGGNLLAVYTDGTVEVLGRAPVAPPISPSPAPSGPPCDPAVNPDCRGEDGADGADGVDGKDGLDGRRCSDGFTWGPVTYGDNRPGEGCVEDTPPPPPSPSPAPTAGPSTPPGPANGSDPSPQPSAPADQPASPAATAEPTDPPANTASSPEPAPEAPPTRREPPDAVTDRRRVAASR